VPRVPAIALCACALLWCAGPASAQQAPEAQYTELARAAKQDYDRLYERNRADMHPGDPLLVRGIDQEDNNSCAGTPLLATRVSSATQVDTEELRRRTLDMYESRATFRSPLQTPQRKPARETRATRTRVPEEQPQPGSGVGPWLTAAVLVGAIFWWRTRSRAAG